MPRNRIAEAQELERVEQLTLQRLSNLREQLQQTVSSQRRLSPALLQSLDQAASDHKAACLRQEAFAEKTARKAGPERPASLKQRFGQP